MCETCNLTGNTEKSISPEPLVRSSRRSKPEPVGPGPRLTRTEDPPASPEGGPPGGPVGSGKIRKPSARFSRSPSLRIFWDPIRKTCAPSSATPRSKDGVDRPSGSGDIGKKPIFDLRLDIAPPGPPMGGPRLGPHLKQGPPGPVLTPIRGARAAVLIFAIFVPPSDAQGQFAKIENRENQELSLTIGMGQPPEIFTIGMARGCVAPLRAGSRKSRKPVRSD